MRYTEWVEAVLRAILERPEPQFMFGMRQLGTALGQAGSWGAAERRDFDNALSAAVDDLDERNLLASSDPNNLAATPEARRYRTHSLRELWPVLRAGDLELDEELYLATLAELSEVPHDGWAEVRQVPSPEVFAALGWEWDRTRSLRVLEPLVRCVFADTRSTADMDHARLRLAGAVRVSDEVGSALAEARDHLSIRRVRAAGCVAGVVLERRLKELCLARSLHVSDKAPSLADYNRALKGAKVYPLDTWRKIDHLSDLRNLCAHVLDREPSSKDALELIEGIDAVLRALPD